MLSRDQLGKKSQGSLYEYFLQRYGTVNSVPYQQARMNFIRSMAAYSVVSWILQIKDRHNGNILVGNDGHLIHIDFGFIFDISPGGNMKFERSPFKFTQEMVDIMGGSQETEQFKWFIQQAIRAFLAVREHMDSVITLVQLMLSTNFECFKENTIENLRSRFCPDTNVADAAKYFLNTIFDCFSNVSNFTTWVYDKFQSISNDIEY